MSRKPDRALTCVPRIWALFPARLRLSALFPTQRTEGTDFSLSSSPAKAPQTPRIWEISLFPQHTWPGNCPPGRGQCCSRVQENDWALPPVSPKFGHCPRVFQRTGRCPRTLGTAPGVPLTSSSVRRRRTALARWLGSSRARGRSFPPPASSFAVSSPPPPRPRPASASAPPQSRRGWRPPRAAAGDTRTGRGSLLRACGSAAALAGTWRPETGAAYVCSFKDHSRGEGASVAPKRGGPGAGSEGRRGEAHPVRAAQRLQVRGSGDLGRCAASAGAVIDGGERGRAGTGFRRRRPLPLGEARVAGAPRAGRGARACAWF